jgi:integrase/recombinase XerD
VLRAAFRLELMTERDFRAASDLPPIRGARLRAGRALTAAELLRVFACAGSGPVGQRNAAALALLYGAGLRRAELCALDLAAVELATGTIRVAGKGRVERLVYVPAGAVAAVADWLEVRGREPGPLLWAAAADRRTLEARAMAPSAVYSLCSRVAARAGIPPFRPHDLRRTWAGDLLDAGLDLATVQALAGHRNVQTTAGYDRRAERTKMRARDLLLVPYRSPERPDR